jgi:dihydrofolate synthase / folylpolyglutamate synthase
MRFSRLADWLSWQETLHPTAIDLSLDRLHRTLVRLQWSPPTCPVITVGGTNGKGSCVALLNRILAREGYRVGTFTSPHLVRYNERITIDGRQISDASLIAAFERIDLARGNETLTFFEFNTLAALLAFETANLDAIILEVGMGGRLDAVNVVAADVALVTSIALDHCDWLGSDVESIAREKAGIFRAKRPAVFGARSMPLTIATRAEEIGSQLLRLGIDFDYARGHTQWTWWDSHGTEFDDLPPPALFGEMQFDNAAAVLQVLQCLKDRLPLTREAVEAGLREVSLAGRFQVFEGPVEWILDVAHNPAAAATLASQLQMRQGQGRTLAVCGILGDKDIEGIGHELRSSFDEWFVARLAGARSVDPALLAERLQKIGANVTSHAESVEEACRLAQERANRGDRVVVFGSFLTVGPAFEWLRARAA